jgi:hypothetical protein
LWAYIRAEVYSNEVLNGTAINKIEKAELFRDHMGRAQRLLTLPPFLVTS